MPKLNITLRLNEVVQKADEAPGDCQDAYDYNAELNRYAVADGVSQSFFPAEWARLLVNHFCNDPSPLNTDLFLTRKWREWLAPVQQKWFEEIKGRVEQKRGHSGTHLRNSLAKREPAAATFVGVQVDAAQDGEGTRWHSMIIGDSCLFHITGDQLSSYTITKPSEFDYHPEHFASNGDLNRFEPRFVSGTLKNGDVLILTTDALAKWILTRHIAGEEERRDTLTRLLELRRWSDLYRFVEEARLRGETPLDDDDVALVIISAAEKDGTGAVEVAKPAPKSERKRPARAAALADVGTDEQKAPEPSPEVREGEDVRPVKPGRKRESWLAILALCLSVVSIVISLVSPYLIHPGATSPQPPAAAGTRPAPTPAASDAGPRTPTTPAVITLPAGAFVSSEPSHQAAKVLAIANGTQAKTVPDPAAGAGWTKVEMDVWVSAARQFTSLNGSNVTIVAAVNARTSPDFNAALVGKFTQGAAFKKVGESTDSRRNKWYQVRVEGFTPSPETAQAASQ